MFFLRPIARCSKRWIVVRYALYDEPNSSPVAVDAAHDSAIGNVKCLGIAAVTTVAKGGSRTSFNRPGFPEMLADIEAGMVSMVAVKDMWQTGVFREYP